MKKILFFLLFIPSILYSGDIKIYEINGVEIWSGERVIDGIVVVKEGAKLIIKGGTKVYFKPFDTDGDEIGDGELYVEGEIYVYGEKDQPVIFTALADRVEPKMWKYVMVNHSRYAHIEYAIFEGAFSGLQVHFSKAKVRNSIFRNNIDGFRFSTANIDVCNCEMRENKYGIRYEERDSTGIIRYCNITGNEVGIFPVTKAEGKVIFSYNNVVQNEYNIRMGEDQKKDLDFSNNYYGFTNERGIRKTFYDRGRDKNLSTVKIRSFLKKKVTLGEDKCQ
ncbi:MAG: right-handed parallel beta-helix repeat-containing protein [Proteobacteria bacterium]|nr:right-handed parallel beta-helix repeat-containing protein [Pseudomonadota bacterium]